MKLTVSKSLARVEKRLSDEELLQLETNMLRDGCLEAIDVWDRDGKQVVLDGHHRLLICKKRGIKFRTRKHIFDDQLAATIWIREKQLGRRNLTDTERRYQLGELYNNKKLAQGRPWPANKNKGATVAPLSEKPQKTAEKIANEQGVATRTVHNAGAFAETLNAVGEVSETIKDAVRSEEFPAKTSTLEAIAEAPARVVKRIERAIESGDQSKMREAAQAAVEHAEREAGDDTEAIERAKKANAHARSTNGREKYPMKDYQEVSRNIGRTLNIADKWGCTRRVERLLKDALAVFTAIREGKP